MTMKYKVVGVSFEHMHMQDNLQFAAQHPDCEVVGVCDEKRERMMDTQQLLGLRDDQLFSDWKTCIQQCNPDLLVACPATGDHAKWIERLAPFSIPILMEKPMAASLEEADRMLRDCRKHQTPLAVNWPLVWVASHRTAKRLVDEGRIGRVCEVHYYDGNRGPLWHTGGKRELSAELVEQEKPQSWFYKKSAGGGSLLDYLGYGVTLGTWFMNGEIPLEVTSVTHAAPELEVDEHSVTICRYRDGLSKFETRWGTFTDPWTHQPQPKCGFVLVGTQGTISSYDYETQIRVQDESTPQGELVPVDEIAPPYQDPIQYFVAKLQDGSPVEGPLSPEMSRIGQQIVDTAFQSAMQKKTLPLLQ